MSLWQLRTVWFSQSFCIFEVPNIPIWSARGICGTWRHPANAVKSAYYHRQRRASNVFSHSMYGLFCRSIFPAGCYVLGTNFFWSSLFSAKCYGLGTNFFRINRAGGQSKNGNNLWLSCYSRPISSYYYYTLLPVSSTYQLRLLITTICLFCRCTREVGCKQTPIHPIHPLLSSHSIRTSNNLGTAARCWKFESSERRDRWPPSTTSFHAFICSRFLLSVFLRT